MTCLCPSGQQQRWCMNCSGWRVQWAPQVELGLWGAVHHPGTPGNGESDVFLTWKGTAVWADRPTGERVSVLWFSHCFLYTHLGNNSAGLSARSWARLEQLYAVFTPILLFPEGPPLSSELKALLRLQRPVVSGLKNTYISIPCVLQMKWSFSEFNWQHLVYYLFIELNFGDKGHGPQHHKTVYIPCLSLQFSSQRKVRQCTLHTSFVFIISILKETYTPLRSLASLAVQQIALAKLKKEELKIVKSFVDTDIPLRSWLTLLNGVTVWSRLSSCCKLHFSCSSLCCVVPPIEMCRDYVRAVNCDWKNWSGLKISILQVFF